MNDIIFRKGKKVYLRPVQKSDARSLVRWINDPDVTQYLGSVLPKTEIYEEKWIEKQADDKDAFRFIIALTENAVPIGIMGLDAISWVNRTAITGAMIGEEQYRNKGYGTEAKMLLLDFAFNVLDLYAVFSQALVTNPRSPAYNKKCGYKEVGVIPKWVYRNGQRIDIAQLLVTQEEWRPLWERFQAEQLA